MIIFGVLFSNYSAMFNCELAEQCLFRYSQMKLEFVELFCNYFGFVN